MLPVQLLILNKILNKKDFSIVISNNLDETYFTQYKAEFLYIKTHYETYHVIPDLVTFLSNFEDFEVVEVNEPDTFLIEELIKDYLGYTSVNNQKKERMIQAEVNQSTSICKTFYDSSVELREKCKEDISKVLGIDCEFIKILKEEEVKEDDSEKDMGRVDNEQ